MTLAQAIVRGDPAARARVARTLLKTQPDNFVARPWGGERLAVYKGVAPPSDPGAAQRWGEAFEVAACPDDEEARAHPSRVTLADGSTIALPELLQHAGSAILGPALFAAQGPSIPLLPKTLAIGELLSVQAHPPGFTEAYVVIDCSPGATLRLGFCRPLEPAQWGAVLGAGLAQQQALAALLRPDAELPALQGALGDWLRAPVPPAPALPPPDLAPWLAPRVDGARVAALLAALRQCYWDVLATLNAIPLRPGLVVHNANPPRVAQALGRARSAEVHALGNPEGHELLLLELRRAGPTLRAWDHVRWPMRSVAVAPTLAALSFAPTAASDFIVEPRPLAGQPGCWRSVEDEAFVLDHLRPSAGAAVLVGAGEQYHLLHAIRGQVTAYDRDGAALGRLCAGESALAPAGLGAYRLSADREPAEVVQVHPRLPAKAL